LLRSSCKLLLVAVLVVLQEVRAGLLSGPSIIIADEAHQMKNEKSFYCRMMRQLASRRRLALTGYPLQNNLNEYYQMILWVSDAGPPWHG
jgi:superfamily II DNA or RNA helicase